jgi:nucleoside-diphosphate-sugar epimerase
VPSKQKVLVVGGNGFIGQHTVSLLAAHGHEVQATYRPGVQPLPVPGVTWIPCDLTAADPATYWPEACDSLLYLAQARSWRSFPGGVAEVMQINIDAALKAVHHAARGGARRFVFASTGSVYARTDRIAHEDDPVELEAVRNFYAASKLACEALLGPFGQLLPLVVLRLYVPYGPGQNADYLFPKLVQSVRDGKPITLSGPDGIWTNPVAVNDVARVLESCLGLERTVTLNVAGPEVLSLRAIGETIGAMVGRPPVFESRAGQTQIITGDTERLRQTLGWAPATGLRLGLESYLGAAALRQSA